MIAEYRLYSSDSHIVEPPDLWLERIDPRYKDRAPHLVHEENTDQWYVDGDMKFGVIGVNGQAGQRFEDPTKLTVGSTYEEMIPRGGYDPNSRVKDMDRDHISGDVIYPSQGLFTYAFPDTDLLNAVFRAYNDWLVDFCKPYPDRLKGIAMINVDRIGEGIGELERCAKMGMPGAMIATRPLEHRYDHPMYKPLWAAAQDLNIPLSLHTGCARAKDKERLPRDFVTFPLAVTQAQVCLAAMVFSGVFERYPKLRVGAVEYELAWAPYFMQSLDGSYELRAQFPTSVTFKGGRLPSDFMLQNVFYSFQEDDLGIQLCHYMGVDNIMWGSDYPHAESTFPKSKEIVKRILEGVADDEKAKIAGLNTARMYGFDMS